jgi:hypothetical protein
MAVTYCCVNAGGSLCNACLGSTAAGTTGRKRSALLLALAIFLALWFQYSLAPAIVVPNKHSAHSIPGLHTFVYNQWHASCAKYDHDPHLLEQCAGYAGAYRPTALATIFFALSAVATKMQPSLNVQAWPAKYGAYLMLVAVSVVCSSAPFATYYVWMARVGAAVFVLLQQVILIDLAYNWNEDWVDRADQADRLDYGAGQSWFKLIVGTCAAFYVASLAGISLLYHVFDDCPSNIWIITLSLFGIVLLTGIQLSSTEGSLLTSSVLSLYVVYLAYSMVSKNPNGQCNPYLAQNDVWGMVVGLSLTAISLAWTAFSWTAEDRLNADAVQSARPVTGANPAVEGINLDVPFLDPEDRPASGLVLDAETPAFYHSGSNVWKLNVVMCLISCYAAMTLTGWGTIVELNEGANAANPTVGRFNMAMIGLGQWSAILLYVWTLLAPRLFPDRDFS